MEALSELDGIGADLDEIGRNLVTALDRERSSLPPDSEAINGELRQLALQLDRVAAARQGIEAWAAGTPELEREGAMADENLTVARLAVRHALIARDRGYAHEVLHLTRDSLFHAQRCLRQLQHVGEEAKRVTREHDRAENRRGFLSG